MANCARVAARLLTLLMAAIVATGGIYADSGTGADSLHLVGAALGEAAPQGAEASEAELEKQYADAKALFDAHEYEQAYKAFEALGEYSDSPARAADARRKWKASRYELAMSLYKAQMYTEAKEIFVSLDDYKKSRSYVNTCNEKLNRAEYNKAKALYKAGDYEAALQIFTALGRYSDSRSRALEAAEKVNAIKLAEAEQASYKQAEELLKAGDLEGARDAFIEAGEYEDATDRLYAVNAQIALKRAYDKANALCDDGDFSGAYTVFDVLGDYEDSAKRAEDALEARRESVYADAALLQGNEPDLAYITLSSLDSYKDSAELASALKPAITEQGMYDAADALEQRGEYELAAFGFGLIADFSDAGERAKRLNEDALHIKDYERALVLRSIGEEELANDAFEALGDFSNAQAMIMPITPKFTAKQLRDDRTSPMSDVFTAPDGAKHRYRMYKGVHTWVEAKAFCEAIGGHLATLTTDEENSFVHGFMNDCGYLTAYFGLSDELRTGDWIWVTGEPFEYSNWHKGEPSYSPRERYGMYFYKHTDGTWNDAHFYEHAEEDPGCSYICEWDLP